MGKDLLVVPTGEEGEVPTNFGGYRWGVDVEGGALQV